MIRFREAKAPKAAKKERALKSAAKGPRGPKPTHTWLLQVRIAPSLRDHLDAVAKDFGLERSATVRKLIAEAKKR